MNIHFNSKKHICEVRKLENFKNIKNLSKDENKNKLMCMTCGNIFKIQENLDKHINKHIIKYLLYKCNNCDIILSTKSNYNRHIKNYCKSNNEIENNSKQLKKKNKNTQNDVTNTDNNSTLIPLIKQMFDKNIKKLELNLENKIKESIDNSALNTKVTTAINTAASLIKYLMKNNLHTPPLEKLKQNKCLELLNLSKNIINDNDNDTDDFNSIEITSNDVNPEYQYNNFDEENDNENGDKYLLEQELVNEYINGTFITYLSDIVANMVKKNNPKEQSIWNTDVTRLNYVVKISVDKWSEDKSAVKFIDLVIKPFLIQIKKIIINYRNNIVLEHLKQSKDKQKETRIEYMNKLQPIIDFETILLSESKMIKPIVKTLAPILRFNLPENL